MNNKRQTIWLVSMLSLMVILSAYYLFTEDVPEQNAIDNTEQTDLLDPGSSPANNADGISVTQVDQITGLESGVIPNTSGTGDASKDGGKTDETASISPEDQDVLNQLGNLKGSQYLDQLQLQRLESVQREVERLNGVISSTKNSTPEEAADAAEKLSRLEEMDERITSLEAKLLQDFDNAVVSEEKNNYKVIVLSDKLEKKQAVTILDLATKELNVTPDRVVIQYVQES